VKVKDPEVLKKLKVGDQVDATFTEAIAMQVTAAPMK
jgi:Cu/Ag efflux protein CusF